MDKNMSTVICITEKLAHVVAFVQFATSNLEVYHSVTSMK